MAVRFIREATFVLAAGVLVVAAIAPAQAAWRQQGPKLVPNNFVVDQQFGTGFGGSVSVSRDGNTAVIGGPNDNSRTGAAWIYTRNGSVWTQGPKLIGTGAPIPAEQGFSVAISADGNTVAVGSGRYNGVPSAAWVFVLNNGVWTQQGPQLVGTGGVGSDLSQGVSVALSSDGNTLMVGDAHDNSGIGAAWVFTRNNGVWTQQGAKLVASDPVGIDDFGWSVAISADGDTALVGGPGVVDFSPGSAAWVFTRSNGVWTQQGPRLVGAGAFGTNTQQGYSVALSADGNMALVGGPGDQFNNGAAWVFTRANGVWTQQGPKLVTTSGNSFGISVALSGDGQTAGIGSHGNSGTLLGGVSVFTLRNGTWSQVGINLVGSGGPPSPNSAQGASVALSADGSTILSGGPADFVPPNDYVGAVWAFSRFGWHDFNSDWKAEILWRATGGDAALWFMNGPQIGSTTGLGTIANAWTIVGTGDFDGDGHDDILWRNTGGDLAIWFMDGGQIVSGVGLGNVPSAWSVAGIGDFDGDGKADILWRSTSGDVAIWFMNGGQIASGASVGNVPVAWSVVGVADFAGARLADILWRDTQGDVAIWYMNGAQIGTTASFGAVPLAWSVGGLRDFDGDGSADILWRNANGDVALWLVSNGGIKSAPSLGNVSTNWSVVQTADFNGDDTSDILWRNTSGDLSMWLMNGGQIVSTSQLGNVPSVWSVQNTNAN